MDNETMGAADQDNGCDSQVNMMSPTVRFKKHSFEHGLRQSIKNMQYGIAPKSNLNELKAPEQQ